MSTFLERVVRVAARSLALAVVLGAVVAEPVAAHRELYLQLGAERAQPGAAIEIRADLAAGDAFDVTLVSRADGARRFVTTLPAIDEGHLQTYLTLPADVAAGDYLVEVAFDATVMRTPLTVAGAPIIEGGGEQPGRDEPIGQPGALASAVTVGPLPGGGRAAADVPRSPVDGVLILVVAAVASGAAVAALRLLGRRGRKGDSGSSSTYG